MTVPPGSLRRLACLAGLLLAACTGSKAPPPSTDIDETAYRDHLRVLSADEFEGRRPGTRGEEKTVAYLTEQFRKLGLKPLAEKSYVQSVPLLEVTVGEASATVLGKQGPRRLEVGRDVLLHSASADPSVRVSASEMVFVGYGIVAPDFSWNDYAGLDVHGKTVLVLAGDPGPASKDASVFRGSSLSAYARTEYKVEEAARQGAAAVLVVHDPVVLGHGWDALRNAQRARELRLADTVTAAPPLQGWLSAEAAKRLFADGGADFAVASSAAAHAGAKPLPLGVRLDATLAQTSRPVTSTNVGAIVPGDRKDEYIVFVAHWDALGRDPALTGHNIFNGATDNASGVAGLLTLAQSFARTKPEAERSMVFLATTAGLSGNLGALHYLKSPVLPLRQTAVIVDVENLLPGGHTRDVNIFGAGNSDLDETVRGAALLQGRETRPDPFPGLGLYYRSEAYVFARSGIPSLYAVSGVDNAARGPNYGMAQRQEFMAHVDLQTADQYSADEEVRGALDDLAMYYEVGLRVARTHRFPRWRPTSEFRSTRADTPAN